MAIKLRIIKIALNYRIYTLSYSLCHQCLAIGAANQVSQILGLRLVVMCRLGSGSDQSTICIWQGRKALQDVQWCYSLESSFYFKHGFFLLFLHNSHGTKEIPDCGNLVRPDWVGNLRWHNTEPYEPFRWVNTEPSVQFRKANTDPSMQFRWGHREFLFC